jgi:hypothetical protein
MRSMFFCLALFLCSDAYGQHLQNFSAAESVALPDAPSTTQNTTDARTPGMSAQMRSLGATPPALLIRMPTVAESPRKTIDRSFILLTALNFAGTIADIESTQYGLSHGARESNPLFGSHPSRAFQYELSMPVSAMLGIWSYHLKKAAPQTRRWMIPQFVAGCAHIGFAVHNFAIVNH